MTEDQIKHMVNRFLGWRLPDNFNPDAGISFKKTFNEHTAYPMKSEPSGTNLFDATQADAMVRYMIDGMPGVTPGPQDISHVLNEWADLGSNSLQWLHNIKDGISTPDDALAKMQANYDRVLALSRATLEYMRTASPATRDEDASPNVYVMKSEQPWINQAASIICGHPVLLSRRRPPSNHTRRRCDVAGERGKDSQDV